MAKMPLAEHDNVVKTLPPDRTDRPFTISVLPRRSRRGWPIPNAHRPKAADEDVTVGGVAVTFGGDRVAESATRRAVGMRLSEPRIGRSTRCRWHDYEETSSTLGTAVAFPSPYTLQRWFAQYRCRA